MKQGMTLLLACLMILSLAACGTSKEPSTDINTNGEATAAPIGEGETDAQEGEADAAILGKVTAWGWGIEEAALQAVGAAWRQDHPESELTMVMAQDEMEHYEQLRAAFAAGAGPDVFASAPGLQASTLLEHMLPLTELALERWGEGWEGRFIPAAMEQAGRNLPAAYLLPGAVHVAPLLVVDKKALATYGQVGIPETVQGVERFYTDAMRAEGGALRMVQGVGISARDGYLLPDVFLTIVAQMAPETLADITQRGRGWDEGVIDDALVNFVQMFEGGFFADGYMGISLAPNISDNLLAGDNVPQHYAMAMVDADYLVRLSAGGAEADAAQGVRAANLQLEVGPMPSVYEDGNRCVLARLDQGWAVSAAAPNAQDAFAFLAWLCAEEGAPVLAGQTLTASSAQGVGFGQAQMASVSEKSSLHSINEMLRTAPSRALDQYALDYALQEVLTQLITQQISVQEAKETLASWAVGAELTDAAEDLGDEGA